MKKRLLIDRKYKIVLRYLILLVITIFSLPFIYKIFTPLTINTSAFILDFFYDITINNSIIILDNQTFIQIIPACVAGSAYLLLLIINLTIPMSLDKRLKSILLSCLLLFIANIIRISLLSSLYHTNAPYVDFTHKLFWYGLSTVLVVLIWFIIVKIFSIKEIPVYTDIKHLKNNHLLLLTSK